MGGIGSWILTRCHVTLKPVARWGRGLINGLGNMSVPHNIAKAFPDLYCKMVLDAGTAGLTHRAHEYSRPNQGIDANCRIPDMADLSSTARCHRWIGVHLYRATGNQPRGKQHNHCGKERDLVQYWNR